MDFILGAVTQTLNAMSSLLQGFSFTRNLGQDMAKITPYIQKANYIIPVDAGMSVLGLFLSLQLALIAYYWVTRAINLIRGAG